MTRWIVAYFVGLSWLAAAHAAELGTAGRGDRVVEFCKLDLARDDVRMFWRNPDGAQFATLANVAAWLQSRNERLVCASNAGIYGKDGRPIGLYVENHQVHRHLNIRKDGYGNFYMQPNGVLLLTDNEAQILSTDEAAAKWDQLYPALKHATQSGPLLLQAGQINPLFMPGSDNRVVRNAACVQSASSVVLAKSRYPINFFDFSTVLLNALHCVDALYLDGSVSELYPFSTNGLSPPFGAMIGAVTGGK